MRLIDAEHLKWNVGGIKCGTLTVAYLNWILEHEEPTVEAIPIEWLKNWNPKEWNDTGYQVMRRIIDDWEKRNETD